MTVVCVPGGFIPVWFVVDIDRGLFCRLVDPHFLGVVLRGCEKGSFSPCLVCIC